MLDTTPKFTKGPWHKYQITGAEGSTSWWISANSKSGWKDGTYMAVSGPIGEGNASLIQAAPDLYEALVDMIDLVENDISCPCVVKSLAAIAKAEGRLAKDNKE